MPWGCYSCNFLRSLTCAFDRFNATAKRSPMKFLRFFGPFLAQMGPKVDFCPRSSTHIALLPSKDGKFNEGLNKLFYSHQKDFVVRQKLAEIFIVQCDFTEKFSSFERDQFLSNLRLSNLHWQNTTMCQKKKLRNQKWHDL